MTPDRSRVKKHLVANAGDSDTDFMRQSSDADEESDEGGVTNSGELSAAQKARSGGKGTKQAKSPILKTPPAKKKIIPPKKEKNPSNPKKRAPKKINQEKVTPKKVIKQDHNPRTPTVKNKSNHSSSSSGPASAGVEKNNPPCPPRGAKKKPSASSVALSKVLPSQKSSRKIPAVKKTTSVHIADVRPKVVKQPKAGKAAGKSLLSVGPEPKTATAMTKKKTEKPEELSARIVVDSDSELTDFMSAEENL